MLRLDEPLLNLALEAVVNHGYGDFFPEPTELGIVIENWDSLRPILADFDLDTYSGYDRITAFAPKSRLNIRRVTLLLRKLSGELPRSLNSSIRPTLSDLVPIRASRTWQPRPPCCRARRPHPRRSPRAESSRLRACGYSFGRSERLQWQTYLRTKKKRPLGTQSLPSAQ